MTAQLFCPFLKDAETFDQSKQKGRPEQGAPHRLSPVSGKREKHSSEERNALEGVTRVNSLMKLPQLSSILHRRKAAKDHGQCDEAGSIASDARSISVL